MVFSDVRWSMAVRKIFFISTGIIFTGLGVAGVFIPLVPTTPFLLLAAVCFHRSSAVLYRWLLTHRVFGNIIRHYRQFHGLTLGTKVVALFFLWGTIGYSVIFAASILWLRVMLIIIAVGVSIHLLSMKTLTRKMLDEEKEKTFCDRTNSFYDK